MQMIELQNQRAFLRHVNSRKERHGEDKVTAVDLQISVEVSNSALDLFERGLLSALYRKPSKNDDPDMFDGKGAEGGELPLRKVRFPKMSPFKWDWSAEGYTLSIEHGINATSALILPVPKLDKFRFLPKDGGTVQISFRVVVYPKGELEALVDLMQSEITISLTPPSAEAQAEIAAAAKPKSAKDKVTAHDVFVGTGEAAAASADQSTVH